MRRFVYAGIERPATRREPAHDASPTRNPRGHRLAAVPAQRVLAGLDVKKGNSNMDRAEHLEWSKQRAREYLPHDPQEAMASMLSDLGEHDELSSHPGRQLGFSHMMIPGWLDRPVEVGRFIEGFN